MGTKNTREEICPGHIIQGNPIIEGVINKSNHNTGIFFEHKDAVAHCNYYCKETTKCTESYKKAIADIFKSYGKEVVDYRSQALSSN